MGWVLSCLSFNPTPIPDKYDESVYLRYCQGIVRHGVQSCPAMTREYLNDMYGDTIILFSPLRFSYIAAGAMVTSVTGLEEYRALVAVSLVSGMLALAWYAFLAHRILPGREALAVVLLMACAPLRQLLGSKAMIDGFFALWASLVIGSAWFSLQNPTSRRWLGAYALSLLILILTKENSAFIFFFLMVVLVLGPRLGLPTPSPSFWRVTLFIPFVSVAILLLLAGGLTQLVEVYSVLVVKAPQNPFAILTGDGPWYRYLLDLFVVNPFIVLLCFAGLLQMRRDQGAMVYFALFLGATFAIMCQLRYGMSLRYASIWEFPMRIFVVAALAAWTSRFRFKPHWCFMACVLALGAYDLRQYRTLFVETSMNEPTPVEMMRTIHVLKSTDDVKRELEKIHSKQK